MSIFRQRLRSQFTLRGMLWAMMWSALVLAICVQQQHAAVRQRERIEYLQAAGILPPSGFKNQANTGRQHHRHLAPQTETMPSDSLPAETDPVPAP